ncbi:MAG: dCTP deaminase [Emergencia sp.]
MILVDKDIRKLCEKSKDSEMMICPFSEDALQSESYDLSVGTSIATMKKDIRCLTLKDQAEIDDIYEEQELPFSGYILSPKEYILVSVKEDINLPENVTAHVRPRTRFTRLGLIVSGQHCNSTYHGNLKLGVFNATDYAIKIYPDTKIAQIVFEELKSVPSEEKQYKNKKDAAYQDEQKFIGSKLDQKLNKEVDEFIKQLFEKGE